jgi:hypothetical protein
MRNQYGLTDLRQEVIVIPSYLIHEAVIKHLPWPVPMIVIPIYPMLLYGAFKLLWPRIMGKARTNTQEKDNPTDVTKTRHRSSLHPASIDRCGVSRSVV